jgi:hypothetical protein
MYLLYSKLRYLLLLFIVTSFCFLNACQQPMAPVDKWQQKMLEAHGGKDALMRIASIVFAGKIATRGDKGTVVLILASSQKLRTTMRYRKRYEDRILLGNRGWRNFGVGYEEAAGHSLDAMIFQYNHLYLPMGLIADGNYKILYSETKTDDKVFPVLKLTRENGPPMAVTIDPETGLIKQVDGKILMGPQEVIMGVGYRDYRAVAGVMLPHRIINYVNGNAIAESRYDTVKVNAELDQNTFNIDHQAIVK